MSETDARRAKWHRSQSHNEATSNATLDVVFFLTLKILLVLFCLCARPSRPLHHLVIPVADSMGRSQSTNFAVHSPGCSPKPLGRFSDLPHVYEPSPWIQVSLFALGGFAYTKSTKVSFLNVFLVLHGHFPMLTLLCWHGGTGRAHSIYRRLLQLDMLGIWVTQSFGIICSTIRISFSFFFLSTTERPAYT